MFTTSLGALSEGSIEVPNTRCHAIIARGPELQAGFKPGNAIVQARATNPDLSGWRSIKFLLVQPRWQLLFAALGGSLGALVAEYGRLAGRPRHRVKYMDFVGPFLVMGMVVGFVFYLAVYYGAYTLSMPFSPHIAFAVPVGAVAGYYGPSILGKLIPRFSLKRTRNP